MPRTHFEDLVEGRTTTFGPRTISREEMIAFAAEFDPQPMHLDEEAAKRTMLGGLAASGWHTCVIMMRLSKSRPDMGLARMQIELLNQDGEVVLWETHTHMFGRRAAP
jgi:acyl dehydratase